MKKSKLFITVATLLLAGSAVSYASYSALNAVNALPGVNEVEETEGVSETNAVTTAAEPQVSDYYVDPTADGTTEYYLYNVDANAYFIGANNWNTRASVTTDGYGYSIRLTDNGDGTYKIQDYVKTKSGWYYVWATATDNIWVDYNNQGVATQNWTITKNSDGTYSIASANVTEGGNLGVNDVTSDTRLYLGATNTRWQFLDYNAYKTAHYAYEKTNYAEGADITSLAPSTWTNQTGTYSTGVESFSKTSFTAGKIIYQTISGLKNGTYEVQFYGAANLAAWQGQTGSGSGIAQIYANNTTQDIEVIDQKSCTITDYLRTIEATVTDGTLEYGIQNIATGGCWYVCQLKSITFVSAGVDLSAYLPDYNTAVARANAVSGKTMNSAVSAALTSAISTYAGKEYTTGDEYLEADEALNSAAEAAETSVANYTEANTYLNKAASLDEAGQASYNANETVAAVKAAYTARTLEALTDAQKSAMDAALVVAAKAQTTAGSDMTLAIVNPTIYQSGKNTDCPSGWTESTHNGWSWTKATGDTYMENWVESATSAQFDFHQVIRDLPNGAYKVSADMFNSTNGEDGASVNGECGVYATSTSGTIFQGVTVDGSDLLTYTTEDVVLVKDGSLTIGVKNNTTPGARWFGADNFKLTYVRALTAAEAAVYPTAIASNATAIALNKVANTATIELTFTPSNAETGVSYTSSNPTVATVSDEGVVTGLVPGTATITVKSTVAEGVETTIPVTVSYDETVAPATIVETTDDYITTYTLGTTNLIANGAFEYGNPYAGWTYGNASALNWISATGFDAPTDVDGNTYIVSKANGGGTSVNSICAHWAIESGKTYAFGYKIKASQAISNNSYIGTSLSNAVTENSDAKMANPSYGTDWTDVHYVFTNKDAYAYLVFNARWMSNSESLDDFYLVEVTSTDVADNPEALANAKTTKNAEINALPVGDGLFQVSSDAVNAALANVEAATTVDAVKAIVAPSVKTPEAGKAYAFKNTTADGYLTIGSSVTVSENAPVYFEAVDGGYALSNGTEYLFKTTNNTWTLSSTADQASAYVVTIGNVEGGYTISGANGIVGLDGTASGSTVYANKSAAKNGVWTIEEWVAPKLAVTDGVAVTATTGKKYNVTYTRNFKKAESWQSLYLPFAIDMDSVDWTQIAIAQFVPEECSIDDEGVVTLTIEKVHGGIIAANTPLFIATKTTGEKAITATGVTLEEADESAYALGTTGISIYGVLSQVADNIAGSYVMSGGSLKTVGSSTDKLPINRWYMFVNTMSANVRFNFVGLDIEDATAIKSVLENTVNGATYTIDGRAMKSAPAKGMYIQNGKKYIAK